MEAGGLIILAAVTPNITWFADQNLNLLRKTHKTAGSVIQSKG